LRDAQKKGASRMASNVERANEAAERLAETTRDSYQTVLDHAVSLQERNVRFAQGVIDESIRELRHQVESNRAMTRELVERIEKQRDAYRTFVGRSLDAYIDLAYAPLSYYREGLEAGRKVAR
jgi:predicted RNA-binding protein with PIN domain